MKKNWFKTHIFSLDYVLIITATLLGIIGILLLYSATDGDAGMRRLTVQTAIFVGGFFLMFFVSMVDYRLYRGLRTPIYIVSVLVLLFVLFLGIGKEETGANSWIRFFGIGIQPSEPVKIAFVVFFSYLITDAKEAGNFQNKKQVLLYLFYFSVIAGLVVLQNDTGTALVFAFIFVCMLYAAGISYKYILAALFSLLVLLPIAWFLMAPYQKERILVFFYPERDPLGAGYQVIKSKIAIGSGKLLGRGYLSGPQNRLGALPEKETDFIFGVLGEEFGFLGCLFTVSLLFLLVFRIFVIARRVKDEAGSLILVGIGAMFLFHTVQNVCMCLGLLPVTGIPLPFLSYGGSSLLTNFLATGIVQNIYKTSKELSFKT